MQSNLRLACVCAASVLVLSSCDYVPTWMGGEEKEIVRLPGERITVLPVKSNIAADADLASLAVVFPAPTANTDWPQHTGVLSANSSNLALAGTLEDESSAQAGDGEDFEHTMVPRPVVAGGMVFAMDAAGRVSAHDAADIGTVRWQSEGVAEEDDHQVFGGGLAYDQGKLFVSSGRGLVVALDAATGKEVWRKATTIPFRSAPKVEGGRLYVLSIDSQLYALNAANGEVLWSHRGINETARIQRSVSPVVAGGSVIVPYASGELYALSVTDGQEIWQQSLNATERTQATSIFSGIGGDPIVDSDVVFAISSGGLLSVTSLYNGQKIWDKAVASVSTPWISGDYLFVLTSENTLICFVKYSGRVRWVLQLPGYEDEEDKKHPISWAAPVLANGNLMIAGSRGEMRAISAADGKLVSTLSIPDEVFGSPVIAGGVMYFVTKDATLHSLK
ncbi:MAG: PQQ-binding-like beta-propeller repeat protein [Alphaproteobacteria bacterium]